MYVTHKIREFAKREIAQMCDLPTTAIDTNRIYQMGELVDMLKDSYEIEETELELKAEHGVDHMTCHEDWGDANPQARKLFEDLEHHYMGYWNNLAMYEKNGCETSKAKMLEHFRHQLHAHDAIAGFVKGNCPVACPEIKMILMDWMQKK